MERELQQIQLLGFFGIFKKALNIITSNRKIFSQITLSIILPNSFFIFLYGEIVLKQYVDHTQMGFQRHSKISDNLSSEWTTSRLFQIVYSICLQILSLLSTSAVVYTVACIYTAKEITYKKVIKVVPMVWKRLTVTFIWNFIISSALSFVALLVITVCIVTLVIFGLSAIVPKVGIILFLVYLLGPGLYISIISQLALVISVLEDVYGIQAFFKSKDLIKGNTGVCAAIFLILLIQNFCFIGILYFGISVVGGDSVLGEILYACFWIMFMSVWILFELVIQTIIYFICKSYHHEKIDKSSLADHLEVYRGNYVPLKSKDAQLEYSEV